MGQTTVSNTGTTGASSRDALIGLPFNDSDDVLRAAIDEASVPALLMSMVHMTGDIGLLDELPKPFMLIPMDLQGGMSEADKQTVRERAYDVVRDYRDRGCPVPFLPDAEQMRVMLDVMSTGQVTEDHVDYVAADLTPTLTNSARRCHPHRNNAATFTSL